MTHIPAFSPSFIPDTSVSTSTNITGEAAPPSLTPETKMKLPGGGAIAKATLTLVENMKRTRRLFSVFAQEKTLIPKTRDLLEKAGVKNATDIILAQEDLADAVFEYDFFDTEKQETVKSKAALIWDRDDYPTRRSMSKLTHLPDCKGPEGIKSVGRTGMHTLEHLVLGPQPSETTIKQLTLDAQEKNKKLAIVDLRAEFHFFINGIPFSFFFPKHNWTNIGKSAKEIEAEAEKIKDKLQAHLQKRLDDGKQIEFATKNKVKKGKFDTSLAGAPPNQIEFTEINIETPRQFYARHGAAYIFSPTSDHVAATVEGIDACDADLRTLMEQEGEENLLLYAQCAGGYGRTTDFGTREDSRKNAAKLFNEFSAENFEKRQEEMRGAASNADDSTYAAPREEKKDTNFMYNLFRQKVPFNHPKTFKEWLTEGDDK